MGIRVLIVDQELIFADALAARLGAEQDIEVVGAVQAKAAMPCPLVRKHADIVLLDADIPGEAGNRLCSELSGRDERIGIIMLSSSCAPTRVVQAIRAGAAGWVRKDESLQHLVQVIHGVARGETWLPPAEAGNVVRLLLQEQDRHSLLATLTPREQAVLACLAQGTASRDLVAEQLHLSVNTVRTHLRNLMAKLGVHSALEAVALTRDGLSWQTTNGRSPW